MKKIYVVLSHTGTILSKIIKLKTSSEFTHVSISLDKKLNELYSFGRLNKYNPFVGGFVVESKNYGTFQRFKKTKIQVCEINISEDQFDLLNSEIEKFKINKKNFTFNVLGMFLAGINVRLKKDKSFYCAEFVRCVLEKVEVDLTDIPSIVRPEHFKKLHNMNVIYKGLFMNYNCKVKKSEKFLFAFIKKFVKI